MCIGCVLMYAWIRKSTYLENAEQTRRGSLASWVYLDCNRARVSISSPGLETGPLDWDLVSIPIKKSSLACEPSISFFSIFVFAVSIILFPDVWAAVQCINHDQRPEGQLLRRDSSHMCMIPIHTCTYTI